MSLSVFIPMLAALLLVLLGLQGLLLQRLLHFFAPSGSEPLRVLRTLLWMILANLLVGLAVGLTGLNRQQFSPLLLLAVFSHLGASLAVLQIRHPLNLRQVLIVLIAFWLQGSLLAGFVRHSFAQAYRIPSGSMQPTLQVDDHILVSRASHWRPERGAIVVHRGVDDPGVYFVKRVIGLPGEIVEVRDHRVLIDGDRELDQWHGLAPASPNSRSVPGLATQPALRLGVDEYYLLGDNRPNSADSRFYGPVRGEQIIGPALLRYWPLERLGPVNPTDRHL